MYSIRFHANIHILKFNASMRESLFNLNIYPIKRNWIVSYIKNNIADNNPIFAKKNNVSRKEC